MSATATAAPASSTRLTFGGAVRAELLKMITLRGIWWVTGLSVGLSAFFVGTSSRAVPDGQSVGAWTVTTIATAALFPWVIAAVYATLQATGEWSSGMFRVTLAAVPRRNLWLVAKATAVGLVAGAIGILITALSTGIVLIKYGSAGATVDWGLGATWQVFIGVPAVFVMTAIMSVGVGALVRSSGLAVTALIVLLVALPFAGLLFGLEWMAHIASYLPSGAGDAVIGSTAFGPAVDDQGFALGAIVLLAWAVVPCVAASVVMNRRDA